jgi:hypothetical protein
MTACSGASTKPSIPPTAPEVRCQQPVTAPLPKAPRGDQWIETRDAKARLSERAAAWIAELLATVRKERELRRIEHACLDEHEARGAIRQ